ncbi:hypothetical protein AV530_020099 [Patagioenas fasciata monilis]|uniref:Uncharacterized protein n=1 Tax=Patagioenas fasciata monilis TaxID=372326 RepID=A0A1V4JI16_PATFA|nr:hypothetical protein AV530_020099 [Patagioenas fasciata monilis]
MPESKTKGWTQHCWVPCAVFSAEAVREPGWSASLKELLPSCRDYIAGQGSPAAACRAAPVRMMDHLPVPDPSPSLLQ